MTKTDFCEALFLNWLARGTAIPALTGYAAFFTVAPGEAGGGTESTYGSYARQPLSAAVFASPSTGSTITNTSAITFPTNTGASQTIVAIGIFDALVAGNLLHYHVMSPTITVNNGDTPRFAAGQFVINED